MCGSESTMCSFSVVKSEGAGTGNILADSYGIKAEEEGDEELIIYDITNDERYAEDIAQYLNINQVSREHISQVIEEILCMWPHLK